MKLHKHEKCITTVEDWETVCPPKKGEIQWKDGRSAKELAKFITASLPAMPAEMEAALKDLAPADAAFHWDAEYVTALPGFGEGRNHDMLLYNDELVVTVEAKADETLGKLVSEEMHGASVNKLHRISELLRILFKGGFRDYPSLRYQLLTASVGTILEAQNRGVNTAVLLVVVFKTNDNVKNENITDNHRDVLAFLKAANAYDEHGCAVIPNNTDVKLYFKEIVL